MGYYKRSSYRKDPYWTVARFDSSCSCGACIKKGTDMFYYPLTKTALCPQCSNKAAGDFELARQDEDFYNSMY
jgi:hypothetical protein